MPTVIYIPRASEYIEAAKRLYERGEISKSSYEKVKKRCGKIAKNEPKGNSWIAG